MTIDPLTRRAVELTTGWPPSANIQGVKDLIEKAWAMGFSLVPDPDGPEKLSYYHHWMMNALRPADRDSER